MSDITSAIRNTVPISMFNRGLAGKIFEDVKKNGAKVVMKNNVAECVLLSPEEYVALIDAVNDTKLLAIAEERWAHYDPKTVLTAEEVYRDLGITQEEIENCDEVEFE